MSQLDASDGESGRHDHNRDIAEPTPLRLPGAARAAGFAEPREAPTVPPPAPAPDPRPTTEPAPPHHRDDSAESSPPAVRHSWDRFAPGQAAPPEWTQHPGGPAPQVPVTWTPPPPPEPPAQWRGSRERLIKFASLGFAKPKASPGEIEDRRNRKLIREATWPRSVAIGVVNEKGGSGKTPLTLVLAGILAQIRGGGVCACDFARSMNGLADSAEGRQARCISELVQDPEAYATPGQIAAFATRQTSFADVIGSLHERPFDSDSVRRARVAIDRCYAISVADTGNAHEDSAYQAVTHESDLLVVPIAPEYKSIKFGLKLINLLQTDPSWRPRPIIAVLMQSDPVANPQYAAAGILESYQRAGVTAALEIPFDPALKTTPITVGKLSAASEIAWTRLAAAVVANITVID